MRSLGTLIGFRPKIIILQTTAVRHQLWGRSFNRPIPNQNLTINSHYRLHSFALAKQGSIEGFKFFTKKKCINYWLSPIQFGKTIDYYSARWLSLIEFSVLFVWLCINTTIYLQSAFSSLRPQVKHLHFPPSICRRCRNVNRPGPVCCINVHHRGA